MKGFIFSSSSTVDGIVLFPCCRWASAQRSFAEICVLLGSSHRANRRLSNVYSWPQNSRQEPGSDAMVVPRLCCICSALPSKKRPQPPTNNVSPVNNAGVWLRPFDSMRKHMMGPGKGSNAMVPTYRSVIATRSLLSIGHFRQLYGSRSATAWTINYIFIE